VTETHQASRTAPETGKTPEKADDVSNGLTEELTALRAISEAADRTSGEEYFQAFVRILARAVDAHYAFVAEFASPESSAKARTIAFWARDRIADNFEWVLAGTPQRFPRDRTAIERGIESYLGVPLRDAGGKVFGHLAIFDERPMPEEPRKLLTFRIFGPPAS
jgi:hypothetical protein